MLRERLLSRPRHGLAVCGSRSREERPIDPGGGPNMTGEDRSIVSLANPAVQSCWLCGTRCRPRDGRRRRPCVCGPALVLRGHPALHRTLDFALVNRARRRPRSGGNGLSGNGRAAHGATSQGPMAQGPLAPGLLAQGRSAQGHSTQGHSTQGHSTQGHAGTQCTGKRRSGKRRRPGSGIQRPPGPGPGSGTGPEGQAAGRLI